MRLTTIRTKDGTRAAREEPDGLYLLEADSVTTLLSDPNWRSLAAKEGKKNPDPAPERATVVPMPEKVICVGLNYRSHALETGLDLPDHPAIFAKYGRSLIGSNDPIVLPGNAQKVDWEAELGVVIGAPARHVSEAQASDAIAGYVVANDISMRDWQSRTTQWLQGKTFEDSTPVGPSLVTLDELDDPSSLALSCEIDGEVVQESNTSDLIFSPAQIVSYLSEIFTLVPGDLILTGTPGGIGARHTPPRFLRADEVLTTRIEGVGVLQNTVVPRA